MTALEGSLHQVRPIRQVLRREGFVLYLKKGNLRAIPDSWSNTPDGFGRVDLRVLLETGFRTSAEEALSKYPSEVVDWIVECLRCGLHQSPRRRGGY